MRSIEILEIHVAHGCNLSCESCSHFAGNGLQGLVSLEEAETWMSAWNRRLQPRFFGLLGGEPGLHPHLAQYVWLARKNWSSSQLRLQAIPATLPGQSLEVFDDCLPAIAEGGIPRAFVPLGPLPGLRGACPGLHGGRTRSVPRRRGGRDLCHVPDRTGVFREAFTAGRG